MVFWTNDYRNTLVPLLEEFGLLKDGSKGGDGRTSFWLTNDRSVPLLETAEYIALWIMKNLNVSDPNQAILRVIGYIPNFFLSFFLMFDFFLFDR